MIVQYLGFEALSDSRVYRFRVVDEQRKERLFGLRIPNQAFLDFKLKYQDAPDLCLCKLKSDLEAETAERLLLPEQIVSDAEIQRYVDDHTPSKRKPAQSA
ncbi:MAG: hypothetical protein AB1898_23070 [Acidobacteriota bacterium]